MFAFMLKFLLILLSAIEHLKGYFLHLKFALNNIVSQFLNSLSNFLFFSPLPALIQPRMKFGVILV